MTVPHVATTALPGEYWACTHPPAPDPNNGAVIVMRVSGVCEDCLQGTLALGQPDWFDFEDTDCTIRPATEDEIAGFKAREEQHKLRPRARERSSYGDGKPRHYATASCMLNSEGHLLPYLVASTDEQLDELAVETLAVYPNHTVVKVPVLILEHGNPDEMREALEHFIARGQAGKACSQRHPE
jgi:hypothetical protein